MQTLRQFERGLTAIPVATSWYLSDLGEALGKQALFTKQTPQKLHVLRQHALVESTIASNRIEGVVVDQERVPAIVFGRAPLHDRDEAEVRGYRNALKHIHQRKLAISEETIKELHRLARAEIGDAGAYRTRNSDIIERYPDGETRVRFVTVPVASIRSYMAELITGWHRAIEERWVHPLIVTAAFNLDFPCIHPFRDGNGRVSRLLLLLHLYHFGYEVGRYISLERLIEQNKELYYDTLERSSRGWHDGEHDPWPYINFLLFILHEAYKELEERAERIRTPKGAKTALVEAAVHSLRTGFTVMDLERACPDVSRETIRWVLKTLQRKGEVHAMGRGPGAMWEWTGK